MVLLELNFFFVYSNNPFLVSKQFLKLFILLLFLFDCKNVLILLLYLLGKLLLLAVILFSKTSYKTLFLEKKLIEVLNLLLFRIDINNFLVKNILLLVDERFFETQYIVKLFNFLFELLDYLFCLKSHFFIFLITIIVKYA